MTAASHCEECRLERQVRLFDTLFDIENRHGCKGNFVIDFDADKLNQKIGVINFESIFER